MYDIFVEFSFLFVFRGRTVCSSVYPVSLFSSFISENIQSEVQWSFALRFTLKIVS